MISNSITISAILLAILSAATAEAQPEQRTARAANAQGKRQPDPSWLMAPIQGKNLHYKTMDSQSAGEKVSYLIYLPPSYEAAKSDRYPVVYWLHGIGGNQRGIPSFCQRLNDAIVSKKAPSMIFVFANGMVDSFYCDAINEKRPVESVIIRDLIPHIDATYRTIATRKARMIEGFSMGGFGAAHLGFKHPDLFGSISLMDAAILGLEEFKGRHKVQFERIFDSSDENFSSESPFVLAKKNVERVRDRTTIRVEVGGLVRPNDMFHRHLESISVEHSYRTHDGVGHNHAAILDKLGEKNWLFYAKAFNGAGAAQ